MTTQQLKNTMKTQRLYDLLTPFAVLQYEVTVDKIVMKYLQVIMHFFLDDTRNLNLIVYSYKIQF